MIRKRLSEGFVVGVALVALTLTACSSSDDVELTPSEPGLNSTSTQSSEANSVAESTPPESLPTAYWPDQPEEGEWYRLDILDVAQCGYQTLTLPGDNGDSPILYFNRDANVASVQPGLHFDRSLADSNHLPGYGRLTSEGSIEFSGDTVNAIVTYEPTPSAVVRELANVCE